MRNETVQHLLTSLAVEVDLKHCSVSLVALSVQGKEEKMRGRMKGAVNRDLLR
jgi:hypothetical protein